MESDCRSLGDAVAERAAELLRLTRSETQLTVAVGKLLSGSEPLARHTIRTLLALTEDTPRGRTGLPDRVAVTWENAAIGRGLLRARNLGRVDWRFLDAENPDASHIIVEVKIDHRLGDKQLERYLNDNRMTRAALGGVAVLSKDPLSMARSVREHRRFLGALRWEDALPGLMKLDGVDADPVDLAVFAGILRVASRAGDLSVAVPDRRTLAASHGERAKRYRSEILRAASPRFFRTSVTRW